MTDDVPYDQQGWKCPQCGKINAPFVRSCDCSHYVSEPWKPWPRGPWYPWPWSEPWIYEQEPDGPYPKITWTVGGWTTTGSTYVSKDGSTTIEYG